MNDFLHKIAMLMVLWGGILLFIFAALWFFRNNILMALGMLTMGLVAEANYILHRRSMKSNKIN